MPLAANLSADDLRSPWHVLPCSWGQHFVVRPCPVADPGWLGLKIRGVTMKTVGADFTLAEATAAATEHNESRRKALS